MMPNWSTNKYDVTNQHGASLCHAVGCRKHSKLIYAFNGLFCRKHYDQLYEIRNSIKSQYNTLESEIYFRTEEMLFRKTLDAGHVYYIINRTNEINNPA